MARIPAFLSSVIVALVSQQVFHCEGYRRGQTAWQTRNSVPESGNDNENLPFSVISGWIDDSSKENSAAPQQPQVPWRNHVDFDELHPGEDQIAEESIPTPNLEALLRPFQIPLNLPERPTLPALPAEAIPRVAFPLPRFNVDAEREFTNPFSSANQNAYMQELMSLIGNRPIPPTPWYKGSNVCIKREEEDEIIEGEESESSPSLNVQVEPSASPEENYDTSFIDNSMEGYPKDQPFLSEENLNLTETAPEWHMRLSYCKDMDTRRSCYMKLFGPKLQRTISVTHECCHGYELDQRKEKCVRTRYENVAKTIEDIGGTEFLALIKNTGLLGKVTNDNITIFVPSNDAVSTYLTSHAVDSNAIEIVIAPEARRRRRGIIFHRENNPQGRNIRRHNFEHHNRQTSDEDSDEMRFPQSEEDFDMNDIDWRRNALERHEAHKRNLEYDHEDSQYKLRRDLLSHMLDGRISTDDFVDEKVVFSENQGSVLRMNTWTVGNEEVKTINCARLTSINHRCSNGMVHVIDRMIKPVSKSIAETIGSDPELSILSTLITSSGMSDLLSDRNQNLTFFAPTNAAIHKLGHSVLHKLQNGDPCLKRILRHHLLPLTFCTCVVYKQGQVRNVDHDVLDIDRDANDNLFINGSQILVRDIMTTNGVIHVIDTVLMSDKDQPMSKSLERDGYTHFIDALRTARLEEYLDEQTNVTLFAPTNKAMEELGQDVLSNPLKLREILLYHIITPELKTCDFSNDQLLPSRLNERNVRINMYSHFPVDLNTEITAQCGRITQPNRMACNGVIHQVDRVLLPAELDTIETLKTQRDFSIFYRLLVQSGLLDKLKQPNTTITIFAPTDTAFYTLARDEFSALLNSVENATKVIKNHIIEEPLCCAGVAPNNWFMTKRVGCMNGVNIPVYRDTSGQVMYGNAKVTTCDLTSSNGIIHTVDKVLTASNDPSRGELMESCLPGPLDSIRSATFFIRL